MCISHASDLSNRRTKGEGRLPPRLVERNQTPRLPKKKKKSNKILAFFVEDMAV